MQHADSGSIDWPKFLDRFGGRQDFVAKLVAAALSGHQNAPALLRSQAEQSDWAALAATAHSIKGLAGNLMSAGVQDLARQTELAARAGDPVATELAATLAQAMEGMLNDLQSWLAAYSGGAA